MQIGSALNIAGKAVSSVAKRNYEKVKNPHTGKIELVEIRGKQATPEELDAVFAAWDEEAKPRSTPDLPSVQAGALAGNAAGTLGQGPSYNPDGSLKIDYSKAPPPKRRFSEGSKGALEALGVIQERIANAAAPLDVLSPFGAVNEALKGRVIPTPFGDIPAQIPKPSGMVAGIATLPFDIAADAEVVFDPKTTWDQKLRATANILINTGAAELGALKGFEALKGAIRTKNAQSVRKALFDLSPAQQEQVMKALPANAGGAHYVVGPKGAVKTSQPKKPLGMTAEDIARSQKKVGPQPEMGLTGGTTLSGKSRPGVSTGVKNASEKQASGPVHADVQSSALKGEGQVPPEGRGAGVRQEAPKEVDLTGVTGLARRFRDPERIAAGKEVTPPVPKSARDLAEKGKKLYETGKADPQEILTRVAEGKGKPSFEKDVPVIQHYKAVVRDQKTVLLNARKKANPGELPEIDLGIAKLDQETDRIEAFAQKAATEFHGMGEALQIARDESMAFVDLRDRAIAGNFGQRVGAKIEAQLSDLSKRYESAMAEIERLKSRISLPRAAPISQIGRRRSSALSRLKRLGIETAEFQSYPLGSKQTGAIDLSGVGTARQQARQAITDLTGIYIREGARDLDEVLEMLSKDVPGLSRDDFLSLLSPSIRKYRTEAAVVSNEARKVLSKVRASAEFRTKSMVGKGLAIAADIGKNLKRNVQASFDVSAALLQGKPALLARPGSWLKSWEATAQAFSPVARNVEGKVKYQGADQAAQRLYANLIQEPAIKEAVDQGWLELRQPHGSFSPQEEIFRGEIAHVIPGVARSDAMFSSQLNAMYGDWYRKLAGIMPENAEYKRSIGAIMNMLSGRGHGPTAQMLSHPSMGWLSFAPKFAYSLAQVGTGAPVWYKGLHPRARLEALKIYTAGIATVAVVNQVAPRFGYTVDNDPRSINFGMLEKDGKSIDGYNQITQFPRMLMQLFFGKIGGRGQYKEPGDFGFAPLNDYIGSKFSPALRDLVFMSTGRIYDRQKHEWRDATRDDLNWSFTPLAIQDIRNMENRDLKSVVLAILGGRPGDVEPKRLKQGEKSAPPLKYPPIGIERMTRGL